MMLDGRAGCPDTFSTPLLLDSPSFRESLSSGSITDAVLASSGADRVYLLYNDRASPCDDELSDRFGSAGLRDCHPMLEALRSAAAQEGRDHPFVGTSFWLRGDLDNHLCLPLMAGSDQTASLILAYPACLLARDRASVEERAVMMRPLIMAYVKSATETAIMTRKFASAMSVLHVSSVAVILFDNKGRMIVANDAARCTWDAHDGIRMGNRAPVPISLKDAARFQLALEHQIASNSAESIEPCKSAVFLIQRQAGRRPFVATMIPVPAAAVKPGDPAVIMYLFDPSHDHSDHLGAVCELYGLSQVETRLAHHLVSGKTLDEAAIAMRVKSPTARTYLKQIFSKTETHRQTELMRLLMLSTGRLASPAVSEALQ